MAKTVEDVEIGDGGPRGGLYSEAIRQARQSAQQAKELERDPWQHRGEQMRCQSCMWWVMKGNPPELGRAIGRCRRRAPTMNGFPATYPGDWCGDHKIDETRL